MFDSICIVGTGRLGQAASARLEGRGIAVRQTGRELACDAIDLVLICVPDAAIAEVACRIAPGPWIAHTSGAVSVTALDPHERRFGLHPLQTFQRDLGPWQFDGSYAAITAESDHAVVAAHALADLLGVTPFSLADSSRPTYHAAATMAASFLVTLHRAASELMDAAGAPPEALEPLVRRTIDNGYRQTGPFVRGDAETVALHVCAIETRRPQLVPLYQALARATEELAIR